MSDEKFVSPVPLPTDYERELLQIFEEECMEAAQRASKIHRFGAEDVEAGKTLNNVDRLSDEFGDVLALADMLSQLGLLDLTRAERQKPIKRAKVAKYLQHDALTDREPNARRAAAYTAAARKCLNTGDDCDRCCDFCRDMIDAALDAAEGKRERNGCAE